MHKTIDTIQKIQTLALNIVLFILMASCILSIPSFFIISFLNIVHIISCTNLCISLLCLHFVSVVICFSISEMLL